MPAADASAVHERHRRLFAIAAVVAVLAFVIVAALVRARAGGGLDGKVLVWFETHRREPLTTFAIAYDRLGKWWLMGAAVAILCGVLWRTGRLVQAVYVAITVATSLTLNLILKIAFQRQPPGVEPVVKASLYAFPSGHTMTATAVASALAVIAWPTRWRWPVVTLAALFALGMGGSRVYLGVHWPSDVAAGLALGFCVALTVRILMPWPTPEQSTAAQAGAPGAGGAALAGGAAGAGVAGAPAPDAGPGIDVVFLDWGNTLMADDGLHDGPMKEWMTVEAEPGAEIALRSLSARYRVVVATNAADSPGSDVRRALARVGLDEFVDDVISSADVGDRKPHYAFYRAALLRMGTAGMPLDPARAVMVGDGTTNDIAGAQRAGLRTIWYNPAKRRFPEGVAPPDATIRMLIDLPAAVDRLAGVTPQRPLRGRRGAEADAATRAAAADATAATTALRAETAAANAAASAAAALPDAAGGASPHPAVPATPDGPVADTPEPPPVGDAPDPPSPGGAPWT